MHGFISWYWRPGWGRIMLPFFFVAFALMVISGAATGPVAYGILAVGGIATLLFVIAKLRHQRRVKSYLVYAPQPPGESQLRMRPADLERRRSRVRPER